MRSITVDNRIKKNSVRQKYFKRFLRNMSTDSKSVFIHAVASIDIQNCVNIYTKDLCYEIQYT